MPIAGLTVGNRQKRGADFLLATMEKGQRRRADPAVATRHLYALLESERLDGFLLKLPVDVDEATLRAVTGRALEVFLAAYGPLPAPVRA